MLPGTVTLVAGGTGTSTLEVSTAAQTMAAVSWHGPRSRWAPATVALTGFLLVPLGWSSRRRLAGLVGYALAAVLFGISFAGCSTIRVPRDVVAPGSYEVPITATDGQGNSKTVNLTLNVVA